jgi:hypothetical protein
VTLDDGPDFSELEDTPAPRPPLTGWQAAYRIARGLLFALLPAAVILGAVVAVSTWVGPSRHDWRVLVQRGEEGGLERDGEYTDESACLEEARARNEPKPAQRFACYARDESPDDEESIEQLLKREGYR